MKFRMAALALLLGACDALSINAAEPIQTVETAVQSVDMLNSLHQRQWVRLSPENQVNGRVTSLSSAGEVMPRAGADVIIYRNGAVVYRTTSGTEGEFVIDGLRPGTYAIQVFGNSVAAAFSLHILPQDATHVTSDFSVYASSMPPAMVTQMLAETYVPGAPGQVEDSYYRDFDKDPLEKTRAFSNSPKISLKNGVLVGRVSRPGWTFAEQDLSGTIAHVFREGRLIAKVPVDSQGFFRVENLSPGVYDLFVSGDDGFAVTAFQAVESEEPVSLNAKNRPIYVATEVAEIEVAADILNVELMQAPQSQTNDGAGEDQGMAAEFFEPGPPMAGGPMVGGGSFGGGGMGGGGLGGAGGGGGLGGIGGGGLGGLLGLGGLAVGIAAIADGGGNQPPATPVAP